MSFLFKLNQPREFHYRPWYYQPEKEADEESGKRRIHFRRILRRPRSQKKPMTLWILGVILILYIYWHLNNETLVNSKPIQIEQIQIEDIKLEEVKP